MLGIETIFIILCMSEAKGFDINMKKGMISILSALAGAAIGAVVVGKVERTNLNKIKSMSDKHLALYQMMNEWVKRKQENRSIADYLEKKGYKQIAIYGMNYVGETLLAELENTNVKVKYAIDKNAGNIYSDVDVVSPEDKFDEIDAVIVTPITFFDEIEKALSEKVDCPIISIGDILYEIKL